jgi:signal transduction histidine kinase
MMKDRMEPSRLASRWPLLVAATALALLPVLALFQYRWIGQVSEAERERMQQGLGAAAARFSSEFNAEVTRALASAYLDPRAPGDLEDHAAGYADAIASGPHPRIVRRILITKQVDEEPVLFERDEGTGRFERVEWPSQWAELRNHIERRFDGSPAFGPRRMGGLFGYEHPVMSVPALAMRPFPLGGPRERGPGRGPGAPRVSGWILAELDVDFLREQLLPEVARRTLGEGALAQYRIAVVTRGSGRQQIYNSVPEQRPGTPDATAPLLQIQPPMLARMGPGEFRPDGGRGPEMGGPGMRGPARGPLRRAGLPEDAPWELLLSYRSGPLDEIVETARLRNLTIGFAVLFLMGIGTVVTIFAAQRAQKLALAQMQFVAGVSHELRTPLAVVCSAADNLADGLVANEQQARRYGSVIRKEGRRLTAMVEQILGFAGVQSGREYDLQPADVQTLIQRALETCDLEVRETGCDVRLEIDPDLPPVMADALSLTHAIKNLISNALKYSNGKPLVTVRASLSGDGRKPEVLITVEDEGVGIERSELTRIFEPFYRSRKVSSRVHGLGLGLPLVKRVAEAHGGRVTVESEAGKGSRFTLILPALPAPALEETDVEESPARRTLSSGEDREL